MTLEFDPTTEPLTRCCDTLQPHEKVEEVHGLVYSSSPPPLTAPGGQAGGTAAYNDEVEDATAGETSRSARRDPLREGCFRRLAALAFSASRRSPLVWPDDQRPKNPQPEKDGSDDPIWPPPTAAGKRLRYLRATDSCPSKSFLSPKEDSFSIPSSTKSQKFLFNEDGDLSDDDSPVPSKRSKKSLDIEVYAAQCCKCLKWRFIPMKSKYEEIRERIVETPFSCEQAQEWKPGATCDDPVDLSQDEGIWAIDKPGIPRTPPGWDRLIKIRSEGCTRFSDVYYISHAGKKLRSTAEVSKYLLEQNPQYAGVQLSQFSFKTPAPLRGNYVKKRLALPKPNPIQPKEVLPLAWAPPTREVLAENMLVLYKGEACPAFDMRQDERMDDFDTSN